MRRVAGCLFVLVSLAVCELLPPIESNPDMGYQPTQTTKYQWRILTADYSVQTINPIGRHERSLRITIQAFGPETTFSRTMEDFRIEDFGD